MKPDLLFSLRESTKGDRHSYNHRTNSLTTEEMGDIIRMFGYTSALVTLRHNATAEQIVDALAQNRVYEKAVVAINKIDLATEEQLQH